MYAPDVKEVLRLAGDYNLIPVVRYLLADTETPIRVFQHFYEESHAFLLESVEGGAKWARYSFIGTDPFLTVEGKKGITRVTGKGEVKEHREKPLEVLKAYLRGYRSPALPGLPRLTGGAIGYFGYDLLQDYEHLPEHRNDDLQMNDLQFMFCDRLVVFDHFKQQIMIISNVHVPEGATDEEIAKEYDWACRKIDEIVERLKRPIAASHLAHRGIPERVELTGIESNLTKEQFIDNVEKAKEYIRAGDIFQVVLSQRLEKKTEVSPLHVYRVLRTVNPSPYMYYLKFNEEVIVGSSPELLVRVEEERVETRPIAGTRPRGLTPEEDSALEKELLADEKERAEHLMLVDLGRNDIGRVAEFGTVKCDTFMEIEHYSHVMHIVSNVSGKIRKDQTFFDAFISCLPAGTVSGAPKLRAMEIIAELENEARGAYAGAIGYLGFSGNMDTCITIRTIVFKNGKAYVQAGAGIVWDSVPEKEYEETINKAKALLTSIRMAEEMFADELNGKTAVLANQDYY
ncbi:anthranilate synthase component I [Gorillibacterium massiliense]|uniref:anthranilate synthase component I n=1 Tax=Gorillibacterium massiliense TaxID=1280390 RepID=UPI0004BA38A6|nr:anthranilate synthase component I [Gorillibacterium massiliense]